MDLQWIEIDTDALSENIRTFRRLIGSDVLLAPTVKSNGYGHDSVLAGKAFLAGGADWLCIHSLPEARVLRNAGITAPIYVMGPVALDDLAEASALDLRIIAYNFETIERLAAQKIPMRLHLKVETGNNRQGVDVPTLRALANRIAEVPTLTLEGLTSHFANIEDTTDHRYARQQIDRFQAAREALVADGHPPAIAHISNSAASLLWPERAFGMARLGISAYGLWPSPETRVAAILSAKRAIQLRPALTWKARVAQVKTVHAGETVGYGLSFRTSHETKLAIIPVGYADGYDRALSNIAHVLIHGEEAPVRGRVCMNLMMADVTDIPNVKVEDEVVLLGRQNERVITADALAAQANTIHYELIARLNPLTPRYDIPGSAKQIEDLDLLFRAYPESEK